MRERRRRRARRVPRAVTIELVHVRGEVCEVGLVGLAIHALVQNLPPPPAGGSNKARRRTRTASHTRTLTHSLRVRRAHPRSQAHARTYSVGGAVLGGAHRFRAAHRRAAAALMAGARSLTAAREALGSIRRRCRLRAHVHLELQSGPCCRVSVRAPLVQQTCTHITRARWRGVLRVLVLAGRGSGGGGDR